MHFVFALLAAFLFALSTPLSKILLGTTNPIMLAALYYLGGAIFLVPFAMKDFPREVRYLFSNRKDVLRLGGAVLFGGILGPVCLMYGIKLTTATSASLLLNMETVATAVLAWLFFREHIGKKVLISSLLTVTAGILLVVKSGAGFEFSGLDLGGLLVVLGCFFWGFDNNYTATIEGISATSITIVKGLVAGSFNLVLALFVYGADTGVSTVLWAALIGFFSYGLSIVLYILSARHLGATRSQIIFATNPFIGGLVSFLIFWNVLTLQFYIALLLMVVAVAILYIERHSHEHTHDEEEHEHEHVHDDEHHDHDHEEAWPAGKKHTHRHKHKRVVHNHLHYADIHHRHEHEKGE